MKNFLYIFAFACLLFIARNSGAQTSKPSWNDPDNVIKINLSSLVFRNYSLQYERKLSHKISFALGFKLMPEGPIPMVFDKFIKQGVKSSNSSDSSINNAISSTRLGNWAITPEFRFYTGKKGGPRGFYAAPFARYGQYNLQFPITYTDQNNKVYHVLLSGKLTGIGGGVLLGDQMMISRHISLDIWIIGPFYGVSHVNVDGATDLSGMSDQDKSNFQNNIQTVQIPMTKISANVSNSGVQITGTGPFAGVRGLGLNLGIAF